jgi:hypothetical protein
MINHDAIRQLQPEVVNIFSNSSDHPQIGVDNYGRPIFDDNPKAYDANGNRVYYDVQQAIAISKLIFCKQQAKRLLTESDWSALPDVGLVNSEDFIAYRAQVRSLMIMPVEDPEWPTKPTAVWS